MRTVFTTMSIFNKPGPLRELLAARNLTYSWVLAQTGVKGKAAPEQSMAALMAHAPDMEYLVIDTTPLDETFFRAAKKLRLAAMFGVGLDHIDVAAATERGVLVTNVPGGNSRCVAELVLAMMLDLAHKVTRMHMELAAGSWRPRMGSELMGKTLGVVGLGHIGRDVALLGRALGMRVIAANRTPRPETARELGVEQATLDEVLAESDFLSLHIPGGPGSWHFGSAEIAQMKKTAFLINAARGDLVDLDALTAALTEDRLAGAGLDVFPEEPMNLAHPVFSLPNVVATPHAGAMSGEALARVTAACLDEAVRVLDGKKSPNARNPEIYATPRWVGFRG